jgi:hypothetical protein
MRLDELPAKREQQQSFMILREWKKVLAWFIENCLKS